MKAFLPSDSAMRAFLWLLSFAFLCTAAVTGVLSSIGAIDTSWFAVCIFSVAGMFSAAEFADSYYKD